MLAAASAIKPGLKSFIFHPPEGEITLWIACEQRNEIQARQELLGRNEKDA
jgi:hypothetical protein